MMAKKIESRSPQTFKNDAFPDLEASKKSMPKAHLKGRDELMRKLSDNPRFKEAPKSGLAYIIVGHKPSRGRAKK
jgi:hypothetical protein